MRAIPENLLTEEPFGLLRVTTAEEMRAIDRRAAEKFGIPGVVLMESAGAAFARAVVEELGGTASEKRVAMVCGRGNNGGDGFVAARHLANAGAFVTVFLFGSADGLKGDAAAHFAPVHAMGLPVVSVVDGHVDGRPLGEFDVIGDALFGTGLKSGLEANALRLIDAINEARRPVVSADVPSGVNADTGGLAGDAAVRAARTVTFALPKRGLLLYPGAEYAGRVTVADIGIPAETLRDDAISAARVTQEAVRAALPRREQSRDANKGSHGTVLVIAGAAGMAGAASLTALSALRAGAGLVMLAVPESLLDTAAALAPEVVLKPLPETPERTHGGEGALGAALELAEKADSVAIGPGFSRNKGAMAFVQSFVQHLERPVVIDADGLNALAEGGLETTTGRQSHATVLTPHPGEAARLLGTGTAAVQEDRAGAANEIATRYRAVTLLKGARTLIAPATGGDGGLLMNRPGTPALGTAGSGDVLTGVIAALLARQGMNPVAATAAGAYLHALAGEIAAREMGAAGVIATDVRDRLPRARQMLYESDDLDDPL